MLSVTQTTDDLVIVDAAGKLTEDDYEAFDQELAGIAEEDDHMRILIRLSEDFRGWEPKALWEDVKLDVRYRHHLDRVAVVGHEDWQKWMTRLANPFVDAEVRYFGADEAPGAVGWLLETRTGSATIR